MRLNFHGVIQAGTVLLDDAAAYLRQVHSLEGKRITVSLGRQRKGRSDVQNNYMWGVVYNYIADFTGHTEDEVHDAMGLRFRLVHDDKLGAYIRSTTSFSTVEMEDYLENVRAFAAMELHISIPMPNEAEPDQIAA